MDVDVGYRCLEQLGHHLLGHPQSVLLQSDIELHLPIGGGVEQNLAVGNLIHRGVM